MFEPANFGHLMSHSLRGKREVSNIKNIPEIKVTLCLLKVLHNDVPKGNIDYFKILLCLTLQWTFNYLVNLSKTRPALLREYLSTMSSVHTTPGHTVWVFWWPTDLNGWADWLGYYFLRSNRVRADDQIRASIQLQPKYPGWN